MNILQGEALKAQLQTDFDAFLQWRADRVALAARYLTDGRLVTLDQLLAEAELAGAPATVAA